MVGIDQVLEKLSTVIDPDLKKDIVSMGMIKDLELNNGNLKFTLELTTPACPFNVEIEEDVRKAIGEISELKNFDMNVTAKVMEGRSLDADTGMATVKNIIGVASGKGGVGKSTVSLNLALALSQTGAKVGLLDADIYGPSIPLMLGMKDAFMEVEDNKLQPTESNGLKVVSFGFFAEQSHQAAIYRGPIISGILKQFLVDTNWADLDYLIVDLPPGTGDIPLTLAQTIPITGILVITTPQDVASNVAVKAVGMFEKLNVPLLGVVENMNHFICPNCDEKHYIFGEGGAKKISEQFNMPFLGEIPLNSGIMVGSDLGKPIMITDPESLGAIAFRTSAKNIAAQCSIQATKLQEEMQSENYSKESENSAKEPAPEASTSTLATIPVKLPDSIRDQLKIPLGILLPENQVDKTNIKKHLSENSYVITVGDRTTEKMIEFGLIPSLQIIDSHEKRTKREPPKLTNATELTVDNPAAEITSQSIVIIKQAFTMKSPVRINVNGEEDLLVIPVCVYAPENSIVLYGQPNEGLVIVKITPEIRNKTQKLLDSIK